MGSSQFSNMTEKLLSEIQAAYMFFEMYCAIEDKTATHSKSMNQSKHFWTLTRNAHLEAARSALARIYDQEEKNLSIKTWLEEFKKFYLKEESFMPNKQGSNFQKLLVDGEIDRDISLVSIKEPLVKTLYIRHRHTEIAHLSLKNAKNGVSFLELHPLSSADVQSLIDRAANLVNKYSAHLNRKYGMTTLHNKDYEYIFMKISDS